MIFNPKVEIKHFADSDKKTAPPNPFEAGEEKTFWSRLKGNLSETMSAAGSAGLLPIAGLVLSGAAALVAGPAAFVTIAALSATAAVTVGVVGSAVSVASAAAGEMLEKDIQSPRNIEKVRKQIGLPFSIDALKVGSIEFKQDHNAPLGNKGIAKFYDLDGNPIGEVNLYKDPNEKPNRVGPRWAGAQWAYAMDNLDTTEFRKQFLYASDVKKYPYRNNNHVDGILINKSLITRTDTLYNPEQNTEVGGIIASQNGSFAYERINSRRFSKNVVQKLDNVPNRTIETSEFSVVGHIEKQAADAAFSVNASPDFRRSASVGPKDIKTGTSHTFDNAVKNSQAQETSEREQGIQIRPDIRPTAFS
ncbi:MAG: hypothetical protein H6868_05815 [Rhodospirillales bacterium]|nr:hypothetical protein [Rhodospirillales bacterium]